MRLSLSTLSFFIFVITAQAEVNIDNVKLLWGPLTRVATLKILESEIDRPYYKLTKKPMITQSVMPMIQAGPVKQNPFLFTDYDFYVGNHLPRAGEQIEAPPTISSSDAKWFKNLIKSKKAPDIFIIGGHHVIAEGWHNHEETHFLYEPTLQETLKKYPAARQTFDNVKFAILWGCNTMTNLEPHGPNGEYMSPAQIYEEFEKGNRDQMIGPSSKINTLEFYKERLAREYGPSNPEHYEYTRGPQFEKCLGPGKYENCKVTDLDRILPERGLYDGSHRFNHPYVNKRYFPNAYLVLGYSSASPSEEARGVIFKTMLQRSYKDLKKYNVTNIILTLIDPKTPEDLRKNVIEVVRKNWTIVTYELNRARPSGSITPAYPELDSNGIFNTVVSKDTPAYSPYENREESLLK